MGDSLDHEAVEPRSSEDGLGDTWLVGPTRVVAGSYVSWEFVYEVGKLGMDDGSMLKFACNQSSDWGPPQFSDRRADNYCSVTTSGDAEVRGEFDKKGYLRPYRNTINIYVYDGYLEEGDEIRLRLGDRRSGSLGLQMQTYPESGHKFIPLVDPFETGDFERTSDPIRVDVVPGSLHTLSPIAPSVVAEGEEFTVRVRAEDSWGNIATGNESTLEVVDAPEAVTVSSAVELSAGTGEFSAVVTEPGVYRLRIDAVDDVIRAETNPIVCGDVPTMFWGDIHGQSEETVGTGTVDEYFDFAKNKAFLDFTAHAGNDFQITDGLWDSIKRNVSEFHEPQEFVTFLSFEWSANTVNGGDHNVYFFGEDEEITRSSNWLTDTAHKTAGLNTIEELYEFYRGRDDVMIIPHQGGRPAVLDSLDPELSPLIELNSVWGVFEWFGQDAMTNGHPIGFIGGSDDHTGRPGACSPANVTDWAFPLKGGMTAVVSDELSREGIWKGLREKRCYSTTGERIVLTVDEATDREEGGRGGTTGFAVRVHGTAPIQQVDLFRADEIVNTAYFDTGQDSIQLRWTGARSKNRNKVQDWSGGVSIDRGKFTEVEEFGFDHPDHGIKDHSATHISWKSFTAGNYQGLRARLRATEDPVITYSSPVVRTEFRVSELDGVDVLEGDGVNSQLEIREVGSFDERDVQTVIHDPDPAPGDNSYYVRVTQSDGAMAWSSPTIRRA